MGKSPITGPLSIAMFVYQRVKYSIQATTTMMGIVPMTKASAVREMSMTIAAIAVAVLTIAAAVAVAVAMVTGVVAIASMAVVGVGVGEVRTVRIGHVGVRVIIMATSVGKTSPHQGSAQNLCSF